MSNKEIYFKNIENKFIKLIIRICSVIAVLLAVAIVTVVCFPVIVGTSAIAVGSIVIALIGVLLIMPIALIIDRKSKNKNLK